MRPVTFDFAFRDAHDFGDLFDRESAEESEFDDARLLFIQERKRFERVVKSDGLHVAQ